MVDGLFPLNNKGLFMEPAFTIVSNELGIFKTLDGERMSECVRNNRHEPHVRRAMRAFCHPRKISIDVGACIGLHTVLMSKLSERVVSIEPNEMVRPWLLDNLKLNGVINKVSVIGAAACDSEVSLARMRRVALSDSRNIGGAVVLPDAEGADYFSVKCVTLDGIMRGEPVGRVGFVKVDVEGMEFEVLSGAKRLMAHDRPYMVVEIQNENLYKIVAMLASVDYGILWLSPNGIDYLIYPMERSLEVSQFNKGVQK